LRTWAVAGSLHSDDSACRFWINRREDGSWCGPRVVPYSQCTRKPSNVSELEQLIKNDERCGGDGPGERNRGGVVCDTGAFAVRSRRVCRFLDDYHSAAKGDGHSHMLRSFTCESRAGAGVERNRAGLLRRSRRSCDTANASARALIEDLSVPRVFVDDFPGQLRRDHCGDTAERRASCSFGFANFSG